jgi:uncharacterized protein YdeI (YjbR/CyaY-like superfamily)
MIRLDPAVDAFMADGCGRCDLGGTPRCKVNRWRELLEQLRDYMFAAGFAETRKWGVPCYMYDGHNVLVLGVVKDSCSIGFFKGVLLSDPHGLLEKPGDDSQTTRLIRFRSQEDVDRVAPYLEGYLQNAKERAADKVAFKRDYSNDYPEELQERMEEFPDLKLAFEALTPGRQRGYLLHFKSAKQAATRYARIDKSIDLIMAGKGIDEEYRDRIRGKG